MACSPDIYYFITTSSGVKVNRKDVLQKSGEIWAPKHIDEKFLSEYRQKIDITGNTACQAVTLGNVADLKAAVCTEKYFSACKVNINKTFYLRGLCENTFFDTEYRPLMLFDKVALNQIIDP